MKKIFLTVILVVMSVVGLAAQDRGWIGMDYSLGVEWIPRVYTDGYSTYEIGSSGLYGYSNDINVWWNSFRVVFDADVVLWNHLFVGGRVGTFTSLNYLPETLEVGGWPTFTDMTLRAGVRFDHIEIGWDHMCIHPVIPGGGETVLLMLSNEAAYDKVYVRIGGSF